jgi:hypothetical protein
VTGLVVADGVTGGDGGAALEVTSGDECTSGMNMMKGAALMKESRHRPNA